jgi:intraflagellar transport protein 140
LKIWDISKGEERATVPNRVFHDQLPPHSYSISSIKLNSNATKASMTCTVSDEVTGLRVADTHIWVYDIDVDRLQSYEFGPLYYPIEHVWDAEEAKLFAVETKRFESKSVSSTAPPASANIASTSSTSSSSTASPTLSSPSTASSSSSTAAATAAKSSSKNDAAFLDDLEAIFADLQGTDFKDNSQESDANGNNNNNSNAAANANVANADAEITTLFATSDEKLGICMQDSFRIDSANQGLMGIHVPYILLIQSVGGSKWFQKKNNNRSSDGSKTQDNGPRVLKRTMRDFVGLDQVTDESKSDLLQFSYNLTIGNTDQAYKCIKNLTSTGIWETMAQMCVKTKRLNVAEICLGNMNNARGAKAVREVIERDPNQVEVHVAMLAIQLGLHADAERLYKECGRCVLHASFLEGFTRFWVVSIQFKFNFYALFFIFVCLFCNDLEHLEHSYSIQFPFLIQYRAI